ncbi:MAG: ATP-dependent helicase [Promethearchaeota archaeon]
MGKKKIVIRRPAKKLSPRFQKELNPEQLKAVLHEEGPALIIAGAGSGKTRMLTYRVAYLIDNNVPAESIVLVTFTKKAAQEMMNRVQGLIGGKTKGLYAGTFHHLANTILRKYAKALGYNSNFTILDRPDQNELMKLILGQKSTEERKRYPKPSEIVTIHSKQVNLEIPLLNIISQFFPSYEKQTGEIAEMISIFTKQKKKNNQMDFDDLLVNFLKYLKNPTLSQKFRSKIKHVLVDEFQDVNAIQADIVFEMARTASSVAVVGDDAQSIYKFRGGNFMHMIDFPNTYNNTVKFKLETNYRSTPEILALANASIAHNEVQFEKKLRATRGTGERPTVIPCENLDQEALVICQLILDHRDKGIPLKEQAVLFRSRYNSVALEHELLRQNIPYVMRAGVRFFEQAHIKDLLAFLAISINPTDQVQWMRVLSMHPGISSGGAQKIVNKFSNKSNAIESFAYANLPELMKGKRLQKKALDNLHNLQKIYQQTIMDKITHHILAEDQFPILPNLIQIFIKYSKPLLKEKYKKDFEDRVRDLEEVVNFSAKYHIVSQFLADILTQYSIRGESIEKGDSVEEEKPLILSTIHQAKGLEWKVVFVMNLVQGRMPSSRSIGDPEEIEEERRLFYVACTRPKDYLYLTYPIFVGSYDYDKISGPSEFLEEIKVDNVFDEAEVDEE